MPRSLARSSPYWSSCRHSHSSIYRSTASRRNSLLAAPAVSSPRPPAPSVPRQLFLPVWRQLFLPVHLLFLAPLLGRIGTKAEHIEFQDDGMVHHPVDGGSGLVLTARAEILVKDPPSFVLPVRSIMSETQRCDGRRSGSSSGPPSTTEGIPSDDSLARSAHSSTNKELALPDYLVPAVAFGGAGEVAGSCSSESPLPAL